MTCASRHRHGPHCVVPPYMLRRIAVHHPDRDIREAAANTWSISNTFVLARVTGTTHLLDGAELPAATKTKRLRRTIRDARGRELMGGRVVRSEGRPATGDPEVDEAYDGFGATWQFYADQFSRQGIDGRGAPLVGIVHYSQSYDNAFWDGHEMVFGDGDGKLFNRFTIAVDVIGHELTHGVTEHTCGLDYVSQPGALNESLSDRMGATIRQLGLGLAVTDPDGWLIGKGLLAAGVQGRALRDMREPGTAYDDPVLGKDPQPADMSGYLRTTSDNGGVHLNSGIPNRAYCLLAQNLGDVRKAAAVTYGVMTSSLVASDVDFAGWAAAELQIAAKLFGDDGEKAAADAWATVGVPTSEAKVAA